RSIRSVSFSSDGHFLAAASDDMTVQVWSALDWSRIALLTGHTREILSATFHRDGDRLVTVSADRTARVWDVKTSRLIAVIPLESEGNPIAAFAGESKVMAVSGRDVVLAPVFGSTKETIAFARANAPRQLTEQERQSLFLLPSSADSCSP